MRKALLALLLALVGVLATAPAAQAHAALLSTDPMDGVVLPSAPTSVTLRYSEEVTTGLGAVRVVDPSGKRVDDGRPVSQDGGRQVTVGLVGATARGTYVIAWRVVSADSHPVSAASTFSVGERSTPATVDQAGSGPASGALGVSRFAGFLGMVLLVGVVAMVLLVWPAGRRTAGVRRVAVTGLVLAIAGTVGGLLLQGPYAAGLSISRALDGPVLTELASSRYGVAHLVRLGLLVIGAVGLVGLLRARRAPGPLVAYAAVVLTAATALTWPVAGHAGVGSRVWLSVPSDALHVLAVGAWTGGLVVLVVGLLRADGATLRATLPRWSRLAAWSVAVLVVTGTLAGLREVGGLSALTGTTYGKLLMLKVLLVVFMLALGNAGRAWVNRHYRTVVHASTDLAPGPVALAEPSTAEVAQLRRSVVAEVVLMVAVLGVTAVLVDTAPAKTAYAEPLSITRPVGTGSTVQIDLDTARVGVNTLHVYLTGPGGKAFDVPEVTARLSRPDGEQLALAMPRKSLGHYETTDLAVPYRGSWTLAVDVRTTEIDVTTAELTTSFR